MSQEFTDSELAAYLDEALSADDMALVEAALRSQPQLVDQLVRINRRRDSGFHSLGEIWRRNRISCPSREKLGSYLLGVLGKEEHDYLEFHLGELGCRLCQANLEDLRVQQDRSSGAAIKQRRRKYFQTSAGLLRDQPADG